MNHDPVAVALRELTEARNLLEALITSSESFDYLQAQVVLKKLQRKTRELGRYQAKYEALQKEQTPNICVVDFRNGKAAGLR